MAFPTHFSLHELIYTNTGLQNLPNVTQEKNLLFVAHTLEQIRSTLNKPIYITSGFRSKNVNKCVGGSDTSLHLAGLAVDISIANYSYTQLPLLIKAILDTHPYELYPISHSALHISWYRSNDCFTNF